MGYGARARVQVGMRTEVEPVSAYLQNNWKAEPKKTWDERPDTNPRYLTRPLTYQDPETQNNHSIHACAACASHRYQPGPVC